MADDLERAILFTFDQTGRVDAQLKAKAVSYCEQVIQNPACLALCIERYGSSSYMEVRFWCLQTLHEILSNRNTQLDGTSLMQIRSAAMSWVKEPGAEHQTPVFLRNKTAQVVSKLVQNEFPKRWPTFFDELLAMLSEGHRVVDMFCRIMNSIDEDVISLDIFRSQEDVKRSMQLKDAMRETCIGRIADTWISLVAGLQSSSPDLAAMVLLTMQRFINWIDISLVANDRLVPLLFAIQASPDEALKCAAADVLTEIISKRMEAEAKLQLIQQLNMGHTFAQWAGGLPVQPDEMDLAGKYAKLLAAIATETLDAWKKLENHVISLSAVGLAMGEEGLQEAEAACAAGRQIVQQLLPAVLRCLCSDLDEVSQAVLPFLNSYATKLRTVAKRNRVLDEVQKQEVTAILNSVATAAQYPDDSGLTPDSSSDSVAVQEEVTAIQDKRQEIFVLFRNLCKLCPDEAVAFVRQQLQAVLNGQQTPKWQAVECAVNLLYNLGEGAAEELLHPNTGSIAQLVAGLLEADVPCSSHRLVALILMESYVRYYRVVQQHMQSAPKLLALFLGDSGMGHPDESVASRACYLLCRAVKLLRSSLRPLTFNILRGLQSHLGTIAANPQTQAANASKMALSGRGGAPGSLPAATDDRLYAFEAAGLLLGQEELPAEDQYALLVALLQPLVQQIERGLQSSGASTGSAYGGGPGGGSNTGARLPGPQQRAKIQQALDAITRVSKGFNATLCTRTRPQLGELLASMIETAILVPKAIPGDRILRGRFISLFHRMIWCLGQVLKEKDVLQMHVRAPGHASQCTLVENCDDLQVECLGQNLLPCVPPTLEVLMHADCDAQDLADVANLICQLILRYKEALRGLLAGAVPVFVAAVHALLPADWDWSGRSGQPQAAASGPSLEPRASGSTIEVAREQGELQRAYYSLLHQAMTHGLADVVLGAQPETLQAVLGALVRGGSQHVDPAVRKTCAQVMQQIVAAAARGAPQLGQAQGFMMSQFGGTVCIKGLLEGPLSGQDAATNSLLTELSQLLVKLYALCGEDLLQHVCSNDLPAGAQQQDFAAAIRGSDSKQVKLCLRGMMQQRQKEQQATAKSKR